MPNDENLKEVGDFIENTPELTNADESAEKEILRDKEILKHIQHRYDEEERRFQTVDSKINSMIAVLAMIFTIQSSLFTNILSNTDKISKKQKAIALFGRYGLFAFSFLIVR